MPEGAFYQAKTVNRTALTMVVLLHGAAITALALSKTEVIKETFGRTVVELIEDPVPPPPPPPPPPQPVRTEVPPQHRSVVTLPPRIIDTPAPPQIFDRGPVLVQPQPYTPPGPVEIEPAPPPPPPPPPRKLEPARAKANLASYVSNDDYPTSAQRNEEQGTTRFRLTVGANGRVTDCVVTGSSGSSALDTATCRIMKSRARFEPARDSDGKPTGDTVTNAIKWVLPDG
jgi:protein TonB